MACFWTDLTNVYQVCPPDSEDDVQYKLILDGFSGYADYGSNLLRFRLWNRCGYGYRLVSNDMNGPSVPTVMSNDYAALTFVEGQVLDPVTTQPSIYSYDMGWGPEGVSFVRPIGNFETVSELELDPASSEYEVLVVGPLAGVPTGLAAVRMKFTHPDVEGPIFLYNSVYVSDP